MNVVSTRGHAAHYDRLAALYHELDNRFRDVQYLAVESRDPALKVGEVALLIVRAMARGEPEFKMFTSDGGRTTIIFGPNAADAVGALEKVSRELHAVHRAIAPSVLDVCTDHLGMRMLDTDIAVISQYVTSCPDLARLRSFPHLAVPVCGKLKRDGENLLIADTITIAPTKDRIGWDELCAIAQRGTVNVSTIRGISPFAATAGMFAFMGLMAGAEASREQMAAVLDGRHADARRASSLVTRDPGPFADAIGWWNVRAKHGHAAAADLDGAMMFVAVEFRAASGADRRMWALRAALLQALTDRNLKPSDIGVKGFDHEDASSPVLERQIAPFDERTESAWGEMIGEALNLAFDVCAGYGLPTECDPAPTGAREGQARHDGGLDTPQTSTAAPEPKDAAEWVEIICDYAKRNAYPGSHDKLMAAMAGFAGQAPGKGLVGKVLKGAPALAEWEMSGRPIDGRTSVGSQVDAFKAWRRSSRKVGGGRHKTFTHDPNRDGATVDKPKLSQAEMIASILKDLPADRAAATRSHLESLDSKAIWKAYVVDKVVRDAKPKSPRERLELTRHYLTRDIGELEQMCKRAGTTL